MASLSGVAVSLRDMTIQMGGVTIDCANPRKLAEFWTEALGTAIGGDYGGEFIFLNPSVEDGPYVGLQRVPEDRAGKNRVHIDFRTDDRPAEVERLVKLGATAVAEHTVPGLTWSVLQDPEGNEFCVGSPHG
jgi:predicted enzyme related to lactoylglutathione lyase